MMENRIKIGQIGIGHNHASEKMKALRRFPELFEVVGVVESDPVWREKRGHMEEYEGLAWMSEEELLSTPGLQAVAVETDGHELVPTALRCVEAGMHIHLDKPGGEDLLLFKRLLDEAGRKNVTVQLGYMYRYNAAVRFADKAVKEGLLGHIFEIDAVMSRHDGDEYRQWLKGFQGGGMYIFAGHLIDLIVSMLGKPEKITPFPRCTRPDMVVDNGLAVMEYKNGCTVTVRTAVTEVEGYVRRNMVICGDKGTLVIQPLEPPEAKLALLEDRDGWVKGYQDVPLPPPEGRYDEHMKEFARIVRGEMENPYPLNHEWIVQQCLLEACGYGL
ncbi:MAG: dehydrogenase [Paenibacillaceae bacterium]|jgi:predicted dehydrogenase|nr:dehydrogenase [Paenibacillaceae bacterium]